MKVIMDDHQEVFLSPADILELKLLRDQVDKKAFSQRHLMVSDQDTTRLLETLDRVLNQVKK